MLLNVFGSSLLLVCYDTSTREMNNDILGHKIIFECSGILELGSAHPKSHSNV